jgi:transposase-like protein
MEPRTRVGRAEWQKRIERWKDSGLSAEQFAAELGINAGTLRYWKYSFDKEARPAVVAKSTAAAAKAADLVEVRPVLVPGATFELELGLERKLRIPAQFDAAALERLLAVLERR